MKKLPTTLLLNIFIANIIFTMQRTKPQNLSENPSNSNYKAIIFILHISIPNLTTPSIPTVQEHQLHSIKHNGKAQTIYLIVLINLFR